MERTEVLIAYKLDFFELFFTGSNNSMIYEIGLLSIFSLILTPIAFKKIKKLSIYKTYLFFLISGLICLIMTLKIFPFEKLPSILKMIQFSFRLLEFSTFFLSFVAAININILMPKKLKKYDVLIVLLTLMILSFTYIGHLHYLDTPYDEQKLYPAIRVTSSTGRVHAGLASFEYLPCKAFENRKYLEERSQDVIVLWGKADITNQNKNLSKLSFNVQNVEEETILELPYIYYLGYQVKLIENDKVTNINTSESENGFVQITVNNIESGKIMVSYEGTFIMKISRVISFIGIAILFILPILNKRKKLNTK